MIIENYKHPKSKEGLIEVLNNENFPFPPHFLGIIMGKPGSGKTHLLKFILKSKTLFFKKFDFIFIMTPSKLEYNDLFLPESNFSSELDFDWIDEKIKYVNTFNKNNKENSYLNVLLIIDDLVADLKSDSQNKKLLSLIFNRRHRLDNVIYIKIFFLLFFTFLIKGMLSIIATTQKYRTLPTAFRVTSTFIVAFKNNPSEIKTISDELIYSNVDFLSIFNDVFFNKKYGDKNFIIYNIDNNKIFADFELIYS